MNLAIIFLTKTTQELAGNPDKRTMIAKEILATEIDYMRTLEAIKNSFYQPLTNALSSNR